MPAYLPNLMQPDAVRTKAAIVAQAPIGTPITQAEQVMRRAGFKCAYHTNDRYVDFANKGNGQINRGPANFLYCDSGDRSTWILVVSKRWQVSLEDVDGRVSYVGVGVGLTGL